MDYMSALTYYFLLIKGEAKLNQKLAKYAKNAYYT